MKTLHIINKMPLNINLLYDCTILDSILFIEDGVYLYKATDLPSNIAIYAIKSDVEVRGILHHINLNVKIISYSDFVDLTLSHDNIYSW